MQKLKIITAALVALVASPALAATTEAPPASCHDVGTKIDAQTMESSRSFTHDGSNALGYKWALVTAELTDANASITKLRMVCSASLDGNATDLEPQECTVTSGVCASDDAGIWDKGDGVTGPGSSKWYWKVALDGMPDLECAFSVAAGSGAAIDLLTSKLRLCAQ